MIERQNYEITRRDYRKNSLIGYGAPLIPFGAALLFSIVFIILFALNIGTIAAAAYFFFALIFAGAGFLVGLAAMLLLYWHRQAWLNNLRERIASDGIKTSEVEWFTPELSSVERKSLKELEGSNRLLADAFRETLASRLTATRILKNSKDELLLVERRQNKLKYLKNDNSTALQTELSEDRKRLETVRNEAQGLLTESKTRLEMIEAAARRGTALAGNEDALKQLTERTANLPYALESARLEDEIRRELDEEMKKA